MNILKMGTAIVSAVALFATPVVASAAANTKASAAVSKLGQRIGARTGAKVTDSNKAGGTELGIVGAIIVVGTLIIILDKNGNPISG